MARGRNMGTPSERGVWRSDARWGVCAPAPGSGCMPASARGRVGSVDVRPLQPELRRREPAALADGERPGRDLPGGRRRVLEGPARQRGDREHHRVSGVRLRRRVEADDRRGHPPRRPRARRPGDPRRRSRRAGRSSSSTGSCTPTGACAGSSSAGSRRSTATASSGSTGSSSTSPSAARPRSSGSSASWRRSGSPSSRRRAPGSSRRATTPGGGSSATSTTAPSSACSCVGPRARRRAGAGPGQGRAADAGVRARGARRRPGELRELARGIHPALLTMRGLIPAVEALITRSTVPVELEDALGRAASIPRSRRRSTTRSPRR